MENLATLPEEEQLILDAINSIHTKNFENVQILSQLSVEIKSSVPKSDYIELQGKYNLLLNDMKKKDSLIDALKLQTERFQNLEALKSLLQKKEQTQDQNFEGDISQANSKRDINSEKMERLLQDVESLKNENKNLKFQKQVFFFYLNIFFYFKIRKKHNYF